MSGRILSKHLATYCHLSSHKLSILSSQEPAQNLRSALEQKARQQPSANNGPPKRKMKPGQAKTLSDLPQLSA
jgi:hypothetical protein